jgi:hypothetical protein
MEQLSLQIDQRDWGLGPLSSNFSFNIGFVGSTGGDGVISPCGSVCCVMGAAALDPELEGLTGKFVLTDIDSNLKRLELYLNDCEVGYDDPDLASWFGLSVYDHERLTNAMGYEAGDDATPDDVIAKIDGYLWEAGYEVPQKIQELVSA